jgi:hypothetical protein
VKVTAGSVIVGYLDNGNWSACFGLSYRDLTLFDAMKSHRIIRPNGREIRSLCSSGNIPDSRNDIAKAFMMTDGEYLFFIDTDMGFPKNAVDLLVASAEKTGRKVVGGLCFATSRGPATGMYQDNYTVHPTMYQKVPNGYRPIREYRIDITQDVDGTGAACLLIHRSVLEEVREKYGEAWFDRLPVEDGSSFYSEDLSFCYRLAELGIQVAVNTAVKTAHHKGIIYLDEGLWLANNGLTREGLKQGGIPRPVLDP